MEPNEIPQFGDLPSENESETEATGSSAELQWIMLRLTEAFVLIEELVGHSINDHGWCKQCLRSRDIARANLDAFMRLSRGEAVELYPALVNTQTIDVKRAMQA